MKSKIFVAITFLLAILNCHADEDNIERLILDYPHGETRIQVNSNGDAYLFYASLPKYKKIKPNVFNPQQLYNLVQRHLLENLPREQRPNPEAVYGMVTVVYQDKTQKDFLIYDLQALTSHIFDKANRNVMHEDFQ